MGVKAMTAVGGAPSGDRGALRVHAKGCGMLPASGAAQQQREPADPSCHGPCLRTARARPARRLR